MTNAIGGGQRGTAYLGTKANQPGNWYFRNRPPTQYDVQNYTEGDWWMDESATGINRVWMLVSTEGDATSRGPLAQWVQFSGSNLQFLQGNTGGQVGPDGNGVINVIGDGTTIAIAGNPGTNTLTTSVTQNFAATYTTDDANFAVPVAYNLNVFGGTGITTSSSGDTVTISATGGTGTVTGLEGDNLDIATPTAGVIAVAGGFNITTAATAGPNTLAISVSGTTNHAVQVGNSTGSLTSVPNGTTGQVLTAQTGADPIWTTISVPGGGGALVFIESQTASGVAELNFTTGITSTYNNYLVILTNIQPTVAGKDFIVQLSTNGGASYITTGYKTSTATTNGIIMLEANGGNPSVTSFINGPTYILNATSGAHYVASSDTTMTISDPAIPNIFVDGGAGFYTTPNIVVNAFKFLFQDASNFSGTVSLYGYSESSGGSGSNSDILGNSSISLNLTTSPTFIGFYGGIDSTVGSASIVMPRSGTFSKWYINVAANTNTSTSDFALNVNGVDTALAISVGAGATGVFSDLTNTVSVSAGDLVCVSSTQATVGTARGSQTILFT